MGEHNAYGSDACLGGLAEGIMEEIAAATYVVVEESLNYHGIQCSEICEICV